MEIRGQALYAQMQAMASQARSLPIETDARMNVQAVNSSQSDFSTREFTVREALKSLA